MGQYLNLPQIPKTLKIGGQITSWLKLTIDENLRTSVSTHEIAHDLCIYIQRHFSVCNGQRVQRFEFANCHQKGFPMQMYYEKLTQLWRNLVDYQQAKTMEELAEERKKDKLRQFLMGLNGTTFSLTKERSLILS